jgi:hypothetical protein
VGWDAQWRVMSVQRPGHGGLIVGAAHLQSRGAQALHGTFKIKVAGLAPQDRRQSSPDLDVTVDARWRGALLRYRLNAVRAGHDSLLIAGIREKVNLKAGIDSVHLRSVRPHAWWAAAALMSGTVDSGGGASAAVAMVSDVTLNAKADWRRDSLKITGRFRSGAAHPLEPAAWMFKAQLGPRGGPFTLNAAGARQSVALAGRVNQSGTWFGAPQWNDLRAELSGSIRGGTWTLANFTLPLNLDITHARLNEGQNVVARVKTPDASEIDMRWNGAQPRRLELSGTISSTEPWAIAWTNGRIDYTAARVEGVWEQSALDITATVMEPRAYGAAADSLVAENRVTSKGYFLKRGRVYKDQDEFVGSGEVLWTNAVGQHEVSLHFDARHPRDGRVAVAMQVPGPLELTADSLRPARFPYEPVRRFASFDPWVDGRFFWNHTSGEGLATLKASLFGEGRQIDAGLDALWTRDSVRIQRIDLTSGTSRLSGQAVLPFDGRALKGFSSVNDIMGGTWTLQARHLNTADVFSMVGRSAPEFGGLLNGDLGFSSVTGMSGTLRVDSVRLPPHSGLADVTALQIVGMGDSLRAEAVVTHRAAVRWYDTLFAVFSGLNADTPQVRVESRSTGGLAVRVDGTLPGWTAVQGTIRAAGQMPLPAGAGSIEQINVSGNFKGRLSRTALNDLGLSHGIFSFHHVSARDTQAVSGTPSLSEGILRIPDLTLINAQGSRLEGNVTVDLDRLEARALLSGRRFSLVLPGGEQFRAQELATTAQWTRERGVVARLEANSGFVVLPTAPYRVETGFDKVWATVSLPPDHTAVAPTLKLEGRLHDFLFQRKWGWRDATAFFTGIGRGGARAPSSTRRSRPWDLDINLEAAGTRNRIDTDILRMTFTGDARLTGVYPYMLAYGKVSGLQGEVGQTRQSYVLRDFEVKWDNVTVEDGLLHVEGEKRVRADCRPDTRQTCQIFIRLDGRLEDVGFAYETDCAQSTGEPVPPSVLINSMAQGCYVSETPGGEGNYGSAAFAMLEPALNDRLSRGVSRTSGGFIKSTQVSGLSALIGSDSSGLESVALEVESRSMYRTSLKGRAGYHPETKLANPMEYRLAAEYRPPVERMASDSAWRARLKNRFTVEAAVETRPEGRDIEEERRVRQRAGLRYRHRFWNLW